MNTRAEWAAAIEQTGLDAARFRWIVQHPITAEMLIKLAHRVQPAIYELRRLIDEQEK